MGSMRHVPCLYVRGAIMYSILLGQLCRNTLHEQLGPKQDINKSEDHEGPFSSKAMIALRSEIKMSLIASCLYIF